MNKILKARKKIVDDKLKVYLNKYADKSNPLFKAIKYSLFPGGKRIRPILCLEASMCCSGTLNDAIAAAISIELIHNFSLVHDDLPCMDDDDYRRGKLTTHKKFSEADAVLAADAISIMAFAVLNEIKNKKIMSEALKEIAFSSGAFGMIGGQAYDLKYMNKKKSYALRDKINYLKTAHLFIISLRTGAICAGASKKELNAITKYGTLFGEAFQIRDDIKDSEYNEKVLKIQKDKLLKKISQAQESLECFGKKANTLKNIASMLNI